MVNVKFIYLFLEYICQNKERIYMETAILKAPVSELKSLNNLFIEMTAKNCNQRCKHCYIDFPISRKVKDFIQTDIIKKTLEDVDDKILQCIYLTGAEPMTHPDFNYILRLCLKKSNVCICTNGSFINEKKARFLKRVQDEGNNEIIFKLSMVHYNEIKNDEIRGRGSFRQVMHAIKYRLNYGFNPIIEIINYYDENEIILKDNFKILFDSIDFYVKDRNICINKYFDKNNQFNDNFTKLALPSLDCEYGRILTSKGIYSCPFLANDHRGRCGSDLKDFSKKINLETLYCNTCIENRRQMFGIDFSEFIS